MMIRAADILNASAKVSVISVDRIFISLFWKVPKKKLSLHQMKASTKPHRLSFDNQKAVW
jgi:hypothetical protein